MYTYCKYLYIIFKNNIQEFNVAEGSSKPATNIHLKNTDEIPLHKIRKCCHLEIR